MKSPLLGFNNNVRHKGRVFHIQTEDSGVKHPHIITHLFADGGRILKTTKTSYAELLEDPAMNEKVRAMMQEQHKTMFVSLREGAFDYLLEDRPSSGGPPPTGTNRVVAVPPASAEAPAATSAPVTAPSPVTAPAPVTAAAPTVPSPQSPVTSPSPVTVPLPVASVVPSPVTAPSPAPIVVPPPMTAQPPSPKPRITTPQPRPAASPETLPPASPRRTSSRPAMALNPDTLLGPSKRSASPLGTAAVSRTTGSHPVDLDALERAAEAAQSPFIQQIQDLPPPPTSVLPKRTSSSASLSATPSSASQTRPATPMPASRPTPVPQDQQGAGGPGRYGQSRPASIFATTRPAEGMSIFGEDLISEKSLDEVILSYLAEDLESSDKK